MKKDDYKAEFEEHRKEIKLSDGENLSRVDLHSKRKKPKKRSRYSLINVLLVLFTLIPIGILVFVIISWNSPIDKIVTDAENSFQFEKSPKPKENQQAAKDKEKEDEDNKEEEQNDKKIEEEKAKEKEEKEKAEKAKKEQEEAERAKAEEEARKKEEARKQAEKEQQQAQANAEKEKETESNTGATTHIVAPGETLYRISVNYYKSGDGVTKIMQANGLTTNEIAVGQKLIIP